MRFFILSQIAELFKDLPKKTKKNMRTQKEKRTHTKTQRARKRNLKFRLTHVTKVRWEKWGKEGFPTAPIL